MQSLNTNIKVPNTTVERRAFLKSRMQKFKGKKYKCPALSNADVFVTANSIRETVAHASKSRKSTICALYLDKIIKEADFLKSVSPKKGTQTKRFQFKELLILETEIKELGKAKLTIGINKNERKIQYCVTIIE